MEPVAALLNWSTAVTVTLKVEPAVVLAGFPLIVRVLAAPATSVSVPQLVPPAPLVTPTWLDVDELASIMLPAAKGVPAVGRTRMFCHVRKLNVPPELADVTVNVSYAAVIEVKA